MFITMYKGKIHRATVTEANLNYVGSVTIDKDLLEAANMLPGEKVAIVNNNNGARVETYIIEGERGTGIIGINGAAARLFHSGDIVIIIAYAMMTEDEGKVFKPNVVFVNEENQMIEMANVEIHGDIK
ncbi:MAG: aspartate 1-decarboxylase [Bacillota bacterium]|nr:aspartate 1-decarboxylase [Bacillota bacterium]